MKVEVARAVPFSHKIRLVMSAGFPVPDTVRVTAAMFTAEVLGFISWTCWTVTPEAPAS